MAKQVVAAMKIMHDGKDIAIGDVIDRKLFADEQLTRLYERGAIKIEDSSVKPKAAEPTLDDLTRETEKAEAEAKAKADADAKAKAKAEADAKKPTDK